MLSRNFSGVEMSLMEKDLMFLREIQAGRYSLNCQYDKGI
jgi:hypothetical protein